MGSTRVLSPSLGLLLQPCRRPLLQAVAAPSLSPATAPILAGSTAAIAASTSQFASPSSLSSSSSSSPAFSTSATLSARRRKSKEDEKPVHRKRVTRDNNRLRGVSTIRRTGPREPLSVSWEDLPRPVAQADLPPLKTDPEHGLWDFFYAAAGPDRQADRRFIQTPAESAAHGRAWTVEECRAKGWDDLHRLWWACVKERNRIATAAFERERQEYGFGDAEGRERDRVVRQTMRAIKHTLTERYYAWEDAVKLAESDPEVNLTGEGAPFTPMEYLDDDSSVFVEDETTKDSKATKKDAAEDATNVQDYSAKDASSTPRAVDPSALPSSKPLDQEGRI